MRYYLVFNYDDVDPKVRGPYFNEKMRDNAAVALRKKFGEDHGIFSLDIDIHGKPTMGTYSGGFFMEHAGE